MNLGLTLMLSATMITMMGFFNYNFYEEHNFGMTGLTIHLCLASILGVMYLYHDYKERKKIEYNQ